VALRLRAAIALFMVADLCSQGSGVAVRTATAERVLTAARLMLIRHGEQHPVDPMALEWARFIVAANRFTLPVPANAPTLSSLKITETALATRSALELAWMP
jgi:hypothetical protein